ncbi:glycosyltransferase [Vibrio cholerae]|uniref:glycosyltransferase n=1 Tax=Vibrio cholerae TaxID=666 RepID=UPI00206AB4BD|nr:glycosyltransferase [Vibrio cholerae]EGR4059369.1 glycosyltransferase [Vibrio cholerae]EGR4418284.1 glycosyltransferase [Vibrio cholerae]EJL6346507.1 glycosyltransferase [Vibrio cholerae]MDW4531399.1 glycosyltransferase [Vibrio cholerae]BCN19389.1 putative glycosyltransferase [Vibrio cholerae]
MKILFLVTGLGMGGAETQVCSLIDQLAARGNTILLISLTGESVNKPKHPSVQLVELNMRKTPFGFVQAYWQAVNILRQFQPDVVHSHMVHANIFARLLRVIAPIPRLVCTAHSNNEGGKARMLAYRLTDSWCDLTTNVSQDAVEAFIAQNAAKPGRIVALHNGIDLAKFTFNSVARERCRSELGLNANQTLLLSVGRLTEAKDYPNLLHAFAQLVKRQPNVKLAIIGIGELSTSVEALIEQLELKSYVALLGLRFDVVDWMSAADIYVMSSAWEGMPMVLLEAMATERVVIATDCGGVREVVGDYGYLVPPRNSEKLTEAIEQAMALSQQERETLGNNARNYIESRYSLSVVADKWLEIYQG